MCDREPSLVLSHWAMLVNVSRYGIDRLSASGHECRGI